jgi:putative ABC transport system ATP-binding protein
MTNPIIQLKDVWKIYKMGLVEVPAVQGLNLSINHGEFVAIQGPSGSGKSTAMNMIGALDYPTRGHIYLEGHDISTLGESELAQLRGKKIGFVFQQFNLIPTLNAAENVSLPMMFQGIGAEERMKKAQELLALMGLSHRISHRPSELSGGEQQRVAIARALSNDPEVILADEPTGNLDSKTGQSIMELFMKLHDEQKKTIIMITHDEKLAKFAKRIEYIRDGMILGGMKK